MKSLALIAFAATFAAAPLAAQERGRNADGIPPGHRPPPGMCRIWVEGVPPGRQPEPTDCATAVRNRPANSRVIFGEDTDGRRKGKAKLPAKTWRDDAEKNAARESDKDRKGAWSDDKRASTTREKKDRGRRGKP